MARVWVVVFYVDDGGLMVVIGKDDERELMMGFDESGSEERKVYIGEDYEIKLMMGFYFLIIFNIYFLISLYYF